MSFYHSPFTNPAIYYGHLLSPVGHQPAYDAMHIDHVPPRDSFSNSTIDDAKIRAKQIRQIRTNRKKDQQYNRMVELREKVERANRARELRRLNQQSWNA